MWPVARIWTNLNFWQHISKLSSLACPPLCSMFYAFHFTYCLMSRKIKGPYSVSALINGWNLDTLLNLFETQFTYLENGNKIDLSIHYLVLHWTIFIEHWPCARYYARDWVKRTQSFPSRHLITKWQNKWDWWKHSEIIWSRIGNWGPISDNDLLKGFEFISGKALSTSQVLLCIRQTFFWRFIMFFNFILFFQNFVFCKICFFVSIFWLLLCASMPLHLLPDLMYFLLYFSSCRTSFQSDIMKLLLALAVH